MFELLRSLGDPFAFVFVGLLSLIGLFIVFVIVRIALLIVMGLVSWVRNTSSPRLTVPAVLVGKRQHHIRRDDGSTTRYFVTFEVQGHERIEMPVHGRQWGTLAEGDRGRLTHQGTRFKGFERVPVDR